MAYDPCTELEITDHGQEAPMGEPLLRVLLLLLLLGRLAGNDCSTNGRQLDTARPFAQVPMWDRGGGGGVDPSSGFQHISASPLGAPG